MMCFRSLRTCCSVEGVSGILLFFALGGSAFAGPQLSASVLREKVTTALAEHNYDDLYSDLTQALGEGDRSAEVYFYRALTRVEQIAYWKEIKNWEGVYDTGPAYQKGIAVDLSLAEKSAEAGSPILFGAAVLRWRAALAAEEDEAYPLFEAVVTEAEEAADSVEGLSMVKDAADNIKDFEDKNLARRLYVVYVDHLARVEMSRETALETADVFLEEGNLYLAKSMYGIFLAGIEDDTVRARAMVEVAGPFAHPGYAEAIDPVYAEDLYLKAAELAGPAAFSQEGLYKRAYNLERLKDYEAAGAAYETWLQGSDNALLHDVSSEKRRAEVLFRIGIIKAYGLVDRAGGEEVLSRLIEDFPATDLSVAARYEMGCMAQWFDERDEASGHFTIARKEALDIGFAEDDNDIVLIDARLGELEREKPMAYPLRLFFEGIFKKDPTVRVALYVDVTGIPAKAAPDTSVRYVVTTSSPMTGCMMPDFSYEWSGQTGIEKNIPNSPDIATSYNRANIKVVHAAVVGGAGLEGVGFDIVQVK